MNDSIFNISLQKSRQFLKKIALFKDNGKKNIGQYSSELKKIGKENKHRNYYNCAIRNLDYEFLLNDDSIFQFKYSKDEIRYAFIQNPLDHFSKEEYIEYLFTKPELLEMSDDELMDVLNGISDFEYEQFLNEQTVNTQSNYIRYDACLKGYEPMLHSYSHMHIGNNEDMRLPISKELTPYYFTLFAIKNSYYSLYKKYFNDNYKFKNEIKNAKNHCQILDSSVWYASEENELYLT